MGQGKDRLDSAAFSGLSDSLSRLGLQLIIPLPHVLGRPLARKSWPLLPANEGRGGHG